ncbi:MAG: DUF1405 domain-containing protein [Firmicutes bacterium]|nr:DUF1405 domain-containing protein [Bacillota bacterium]
MRRVRSLTRLILTIPEKPGLVWILITVNLLGAVYGFSWYYHQLEATSWRAWPVVPDSPLSTLLFGLVLLLIQLKRRVVWLEAIAYLSLLKYGFWTVLVLGHYAIVYHSLDFETTHLILSHGAMALEAIIFLRYYPPRLKVTLLAVAWGLFNDYMDYFRGFHPTLPAPEFVNGIAVLSFFSSLFFGTGLILISRGNLKIGKN